MSLNLSVPWNFTPSKTFDSFLYRFWFIVWHCYGHFWAWKALTFYSRNFVCFAIFVTVAHKYIYVIYYSIWISISFTMKLMIVVVIIINDQSVSETGNVVLFCGSFDVVVCDAWLTILFYWEWNEFLFCVVCVCVFFCPRRNPMRIPTISIMYAIMESWHNVEHIGVFMQRTIQQLTQCIIVIALFLD